MRSLINALPLFDAAESQRHAEIGIAIASDNRSAVLMHAKSIAREIALSRMSREVTSDDVNARLTLGQHKALGNAAGGIFKGREWEFVGTIKSTRIAAHARLISVWRLVDNGKR